MELELVRISSQQYPRWNSIMLADSSWSQDFILNKFGKTLLNDWGFDPTDIEVQPGSFRVTARIPFHQEDAFTLGIKPGDVL